MTRIWWCQEHQNIGGETRCQHGLADRFYNVTEHAPCRMVPMRLIPDAETETRWLCGYPEFGDDACMVDHDPVSTRQPRKHTTCGWFLTVPVFVDAALDGETP